MGAIYKVIEQGNGFTGVREGAEIYWAEGDELLKVTQALGTIRTDDPRGNYITVTAERSDRDVTDLTDAEFSALPQVKVDTDFEADDRVESGEGEDRDTGVIVSIDGPMAQVAWDSGVKTSALVVNLSPTTERHSGGHRVA